MARQQPIDEAQMWRDAFAAEDARRASEAMMQDAIRDGDRIREECKRLQGFIKHAWHVLEPATPFVSGWAVEGVSEHLEAVTKREIMRLLMNVPPGYGKSLWTNVFWAAWEWGPMGMPEMRYVATSGDEALTARDGKKFRDLVTSPWYRQLWPEVSLTSQAIGEMNNSRTGARYGVPWSGMMGWRGNRLIGDDPHNLKNEKSDAMRDETVRLFKEGASSRLNNQKLDAIVLMMQRTNAGDVSGYILENDPAYVHYCIPQEFDPDRKCITYRKDGTKLFEDPRRKLNELAFPERFSREYVDKEKSNKEGIGTYAYNAQHQQNPSPRGGGLFQRDWFEKNPDGPRIIGADEIPGRVVKTVRAWDLAATTLKALQLTGARTAGVKIALTSTKDYVIFNCIAKGYGPAGVKRLIKETAEADGSNVDISLPQDPAQAGKVQKMDFVKDLAGYNVTVSREEGDKAARATPFSIQCEFGNVYLIKGNWNEEFLDELCAFPNGKRKDIADACSRGFAHLLKTGDLDDEDLLLMTSKNIPIESAEEPALQE